MSRDNAWECKIGFADFGQLPDGADLPMRNAIREAFVRITGHEPLFIFSGWATTLTKTEREVIEEKETTR